MTESESPYPVLGLSYGSAMLFSTPMIAVAGTYIALIAAMIPVIDAACQQIDKWDAERVAKHNAWTARVRAEEAEKAKNVTEPQKE